jgi:phosphate transport system substrate-binding protein
MMKMNKWCLVAAVPLMVFVFGCPQKAKVEKESPTSGHLEVYTDEAHVNLVQQEADAFCRVYENAHIRVIGANSRKSLVFLINDSVRMVIADRPFNAEESKIVKEANLEFQQLRIAHDALAWLVHRGNSLPGINKQMIESVLTGRTTRWEEIPESGLKGPIDLILTDRNSGTYDRLANRFFSLKHPLATVTTAANQEETIRLIAERPNAIGAVAVAALKSSPLGRNLPDSTTGPVKTVGIAGTDSTGKIRNYRPYQAYIYTGQYPMNYSLFASFNTKSLLAAGFASFIASAPGQKIVLNYGLVPATMPIRLVQIN